MAAWCILSILPGTKSGLDLIKPECTNEHIFGAPGSAPSARLAPDSEETVKRKLNFGVSALCLAALFLPPANPQDTVAAGLWLESPATDKSTAVGLASPAPSRVFRLDANRFDALLQQAPLEHSDAAAAVITLPLPDGKLATFRLRESPIMEPGLAARYPTIKTYVVESLDDSAHGWGRLDRSPQGMHALLRTSQGMVEVSPDTQMGHPHYRVAYERSKPVECSADVPVAGLPALPAPNSRRSKVDSTVVAASTEPLALPSGATLRTYRLAVATTGEYYAGRGGNDASVLSSIVTVINKVNVIYESEVAIRFLLINNTDDVFFADPMTDGYSNTAPCTMRSENVVVLDPIIGAANYDIGHVFGTSPGGGCAAGGVVCGASKANGASGLNVGLAADQEGFGGYRLVAHEMGHQFSAAHIWSGTLGNCTAGQFAAGSDYEPLSGTSLMSYSGTCGNDNILSAVEDTYFNSHSFEQVVTFSTVGAGNACAVQVASGNSVPVVNAGLNFTIPRQTPFTLTGSAADANDPVLSYNWEQHDSGGVQLSPLADLGNNAIFRSFPPAQNGASRTFPQLSDILNNTTTKGELLPTMDRPLNFRLTARDMRSAGGGVDWGSMLVTLLGDPFRVLAPNGSETLNAGCSDNLTWQVGGGSVAANVNALYSSDGGQNFSSVVANTANDGATPFTVACAATNTARMRVEAVGNIFFDISNANFSIQSTAPTVLVSADGGAVNNQCQFTVPFQATVTDDCSVQAANVQVQVSLLTGNAVLGAPTVNIVQGNATTVNVSGSVQVSALTSSPATVRVRVTATDGCGVQTIQSAQANVVDNTPPTINVSLSPSTIWPPNHQMTPITATVNVQDNCPVTNFQLLSVTSSEPDDDTGDGKFVNDIQGTSPGTTDLSFSVRAERMENGPGRTYTATYQASDGSGNTASDSGNVVVTDNQKK